MRRSKSLLVRLCIAALVSGLAALLMVTVGPGFAEKPDDKGPNEHAAEQAQENSAGSEEASSEDADESESDGADEGSSGEAASDGVDVSAENQVAAAANGNSASSNGASSSAGQPDGPPGQTSPKGGETALAGGGAGNSVSNSSAQGNPKPNEDTSQTGLPRGQSAGSCTNPHQGADPQQGGANRNPGPYDNTCNGRASENGSGGGNATGRPCMGCVGNADDKNPPGQLPNGKDHNAGYECDRNKGVGQGNPAHTDCQPTPPCTGNNCEPPCDATNSGNPHDDCDEPPCDASNSGNPHDDCDEPPCDASNSGNPHDDCDEPPCDATNSGNPHDDCDEPPCDASNSGNPHDDCDEPPCDASNSGNPHDDCDEPPCDASNSGNPHDDCEEFKIWICHATGSATNPYVVINIPRKQWDNGKGHGAHPGDFEVPAGTTRAECGSDDVISICYQDSAGDWRVAEDIDPDDIDDYDNARRVAKGTDASDCEEDEEVCPDGSELEGRPMPSNGNCNPSVDEEFTVCPMNSDKPMAVLPDGRNLSWCYIDDVQGEVIERPGLPKPQPNVQGKVVSRPDDTRGGLLPFTGASVLAFLVLALQLIAAGSLILRGRRA